MAGSPKLIAYSAGLLVVGGLAMAALLMERTKPVQEEAPPAAAPIAIPPAEAESAPAAAIDPETGEMVKTKTELKAAYAERRAGMSAEVTKPIDQDIGIIEGTAADLLAALAHEPDNQELKRMLIATYRNEFRLLKKALHLSSAEDSDEEAPAEPAATNATDAPASK